MRDHRRQAEGKRKITVQQGEPFVLQAFQEHIHPDKVDHRFEKQEPAPKSGQKDGQRHRLLFGGEAAAIMLGELMFRRA